MSTMTVVPDDCGVTEKQDITITAAAAIVSFSWLMAGPGSGCAQPRGGRHEGQVYKQQLPCEDMMWLTVTLASIVPLILQKSNYAVAIGGYTLV